MLATLCPCKNPHLNRVSNYRKNSNQLGNDGFDFTNGVNCIDVFVLENLNMLFINTFESSFHQGQNERKLKINPIENNEKDSEKVIVLVIFENHYILIVVVYSTLKHCWNIPNTNTLLR